MTHRWQARILVLILACASGVSRAGDKPAVRGKPQRLSARQAAAKPVSAEAEQATLDFVRVQHPDLADLLTGLRHSNRSAYQSALRDVSREVERLNRFAERDPERYRLSLVVWKLDSRIRLEIARLSMSSDVEVETRLRPLLEERQAAKIAVMEFEVQRQQARLDRLRKQLASSRVASGDRVTAELERIQRLIASKSNARARTRQSKSASKGTRQSGQAETKRSSRTPVPDRPPASKRKRAADRQRKSDPASVDGPSAGQSPLRKKQVPQHRRAESQ